MPHVILSSKGQIVLSKAIRKVLGLKEGDRLNVTLEDDNIRVTPVRFSKSCDWRRWRGCLRGTKSLEEHLT